MMRYRISCLPLVVITLLGMSVGLYTPSLAADAKTKAAQEALIKLGYDPGAPDGAWGSGSRKALNEFQKANGFSETRSLSAGLREVLNFAAEGAKKSLLPTEARVGKTMIGDRGWRVHYTKDGKKILKTGKGKILTKKWYKKPDGTYCEYIFSWKKDACGGDFEKSKVVFNLEDKWMLFEKNGKKANGWVLVDGNQLK